MLVLLVSRPCSEQLEADGFTKPPSHQWVAAPPGTIGFSHPVKWHVNFWLFPNFLHPSPMPQQTIISSGQKASWDIKSSFSHRVAARHFQVQPDLEWLCKVPFWQQRQKYYGLPPSAQSATELGRNLETSHHQHLLNVCLCVPCNDLGAKEAMKVRQSDAQPTKATGYHSANTSHRCLRSQFSQ